MVLFVEQTLRQKTDFHIPSTFHRPRQNKGLLSPMFELFSSRPLHASHTRAPTPDFTRPPKGKHLRKDLRGFRDERRDPAAGLQAPAPGAWVDRSRWRGGESSARWRPRAIDERIGLTEGRPPCLFLLLVSRWRWIWTAQGVGTRSTTVTTVVWEVVGARSPSLLSPTALPSRSSGAGLAGGRSGIAGREWRYHSRVPPAVPAQTSEPRGARLSQVGGGGGGGAIDGTGVPSAPGPLRRAPADPQHQGCARDEAAGARAGDRLWVRGAGSKGSRLRTARASALALPGGRRETEAGRTKREPNRTANTLTNNE